MPVHFPFDHTHTKVLVFVQSHPEFCDSHIHEFCDSPIYLQLFVVVFAKRLFPNEFVLNLLFDLCYRARLLEEVYWCPALCLVEAKDQYVALPRCKERRQEWASGLRGKEKQVTWTQSCVFVDGYCVFSTLISNLIDLCRCFPMLVGYLAASFDWGVAFSRLCFHRKKINVESRVGADVPKWKSSEKSANSVRCKQSFPGFSKFHRNSLFQGFET